VCACVCCTQGICRCVIVAAHDDCEEVIMSQRFERGSEVRHQGMTWVCKGSYYVLVFVCGCVCVYVCVCVGGGGNHLTVGLVPSQEWGEEGGYRIYDQDTEVAVECIHLVHTEITRYYWRFIRDYWNPHCNTVTLSCYVP